ncbi:hypothetical protein ACVB8X_40555 [Streptomyces sp. NRAIS4]
MPRIGWAQSLPVAGMETWEDVRLAEKELPLFDLAQLADGPGDMCLTLPEETFALFRAHGLAARPVRRLRRAGDRPAPALARCAGQLGERVRAGVRPFAPR